MKYSLITTKLDAQITDIRLKIQLSMNGFISDHMTQSGIVYKQNYGVSTTRIKEIASEYSPNHILAQSLWNLEIRETMIMATMLYPVAEYTKEKAQIWVDSFNHIEILEQSCMNLFCKLPYANELAMEWIQSTISWTQITGFILAARTGNSFNSNELSIIIAKGFEMSNTHNLHLYKAVAICLARFCRIDKKTSIYISKRIELLADVSSISQQYISNEVKQEILFLENL